MSTEIGSYNNISVTQYNRGHGELGLQITYVAGFVTLSHDEVVWLASVLTKWAAERSTMRVVELENELAAMTKERDRALLGAERNRHRVERSEGSWEG